MDVLKKHAFTIYNDAKLKDQKGYMNEALKLYDSAMQLFAKLKGNYALFILKINLLINK